MRSYRVPTRMRVHADTSAIEMNSSRTRSQPPSATMWYDAAVDSSTLRKKRRSSSSTNL
jgi:hypothetical protein